MFARIFNTTIDAVTAMRDYYRYGRERSARIFDLQEASWVRDSELLSLRIERERLLIDMDRTEASRRDEAWVACRGDINRLIEHIDKGLESTLAKDSDRATGGGEAVPEDDCPPSCTGSCTCCLRRRRAAGEDIPLIDPSGSKR